MTRSLVSVQEFQILTSNYQAEYGRSSGAQINVVTSERHEGVPRQGYLYHRHEGLNANNWFRFNEPDHTIGGLADDLHPKVFNRVMHGIAAFAMPNKSTSPAATDLSHRPDAETFDLAV